jgi:hypothetical protein
MAPAGDSRHIGLVDDGGGIGPDTRCFGCGGARRIQDEPVDDSRLMEVAATDGDAGQNTL